MRWEFKLEHVAGARNFGPDALSRFPSGGVKTGVNGLVFLQEEEQEWSDALEAGVVANVVRRHGVSVITWKALQQAGVEDEEYAALLLALGSGVEPWPSVLGAYARFREDLSSVDGVVVFKGRVVVPAALRQDVLRSLHSAHQGSTGMGLRAGSSVWWPGVTADIAKMREGCGKCVRSAPSQPAAPPTPMPTPMYPFQMICSDYFAYAGSSYVVTVDRYSGWPLVVKCRSDTSEELVRVLRGYFMTYGAPEELASDGAAVYMSNTLVSFLKTWGVRQRISSAYHPHSNQRAEVAVKTVKRLIMDNTGPGGSLETDSFARAILQYRNTPDRDTGLSPAQVLFARNLRDTVPCLPRDLKLRKEWVLSSEQREKALSRRHQLRGEALSEHTKVLPVLPVGATVQVQNQTGQHRLKWDLSGTVVESLGHDAYLVRMDGS